MDYSKNLKLRLYRNIKQGFMVEHVLSIFAECRIAFSRLRLSWHYLGIEVGRCTAGDTSGRGALYHCSKIDEEVQFLTECCKYVSLSKDMFDSVVLSNPAISMLGNKEMFIALLISNDLNVLVAVGKFAIWPGNVNSIVNYAVLFYIYFFFNFFSDDICICSDTFWLHVNKILVILLPIWMMWPMPNFKDWSWPLEAICRLLDQCFNFFPGESRGHCWELLPLLQKPYRHWGWVGVKSYILLTY